RGRLRLLPFPVQFCPPPPSVLLASSRQLGGCSPILPNPPLDLVGAGGDRAAAMTVIDILTRVDVICQKYDKYDAEKLNGANVAGEDPFARLYGSIDAEIS
uniref:Uncharacterized protein n=2 Tax=Aegilops tauschii subsp. strangulata TaxID=200361 RepID=A0A453D263_AEGTS